MILCSFCNNTHKLFYHRSYQPSHQRFKREQCLKHNLCYSILRSNATPGFANFDRFQMIFRWQWIAVFTPLLRLSIQWCPLPKLFLISVMFSLFFNCTYLTLYHSTEKYVLHDDNICFMLPMTFQKVLWIWNNVSV